LIIVVIDMIALRDFGVYFCFKFTLQRRDLGSWDLYITFFPFLDIIT
jgi:hypothetical protein